MFDNSSAADTEDDYVNQNPKVTSIASPMNGDSVKISRQTAVSDDHTYCNFPKESGSVTFVMFVKLHFYVQKPTRYFVTREHRCILMRR